MSWTETQRRNDWPTRRRAEGRTDASGPDLPDWPTEDERESR